MQMKRRRVKFAAAGTPGSRYRQWTWAEVAAEVSRRANKPISAGYIYQIAKGTRKPPNLVLMALRLPLRPVLAPPCPKCGQVHVRKTCPHRRHTKPRLHRSGKNRITSWGWLNELNADQIVSMLAGRKEYKPPNV